MCMHVTMPTRVHTCAQVCVYVCVCCVVTYQFDVYAAMKRNVSEFTLILSDFQSYQVYNSSFEVARWIKITRFNKNCLLSITCSITQMSIWYVKCCFILQRCENYKECFNC